MSDNQITRVNYFERQFLRTQDFADEQAYHVAMRRRHNIAHHTWGVVGGLELVADEGGVFVQPGMAVDGYGRELILPARQPLPTSAFIDKGSDELEVWLVYERRGTDSPPEGYAGCGGGAGADLFYRWQETARVRLERPDPDFPDRRAPQAVRLADRDFSPARTPPEDADWPVYLGRLLRDPANAQQPVAADESGRPFVGLVGEAVYAPSGRTVVQVGAERADDEHRFAVFVTEALDPDDPTPQLSVNAEGNLSVERDATLYGDLTMAGGRIEFEAGEARAQPRPWSVCHVEDDDGSHELRVEMARAPQGGQLGNNRVVVGAWFKGPDAEGNETEAFHPCLTIDDSCTVTVHGNLVVLGQLTEAGPRAAAAVTQEARAFITGGYMSGVSGTSSLFPARAPAPVINLLATERLSAEAPAVGDDEQTDAFALGLEADPERLAAFAGRLKSKHPELAKKLRAALGRIARP